MIIVAGTLEVDPEQRTSYLAGCEAVMRQARQTHRCLAFHVSADPLDPERINVFEQWESAEAVEAFRGSGPPDAQQVAIRDAHVFQHEIGASRRL